MGKRENDDLLGKVAARIKELGERKGVTQEDFLSVTGLQIGRIESLKRNISVATVEEVCKYFGITISEFFAGF